MDLNVTGIFLTAVTSYGSAALGLGLLLGPLGLPIPTGILVMAAGACARQGALAWKTALALALAATLLGDSISYALGRFAGCWLLRRREQQGVVWRTAQERFKQHGALALCSTRVVLTSLDVATNLIAGSSRFAFQRFLALDLVGRLTWLLAYGGVGYVLGSQWRLASEAISTYGGWLGIAAAVGAGAFLLVRWLCQNRRICPS
jgi:membrane protein DedA with SNARE-associated domain